MYIYNTMDMAKSIEGWMNEHVLVNENMACPQQSTCLKQTTTTKKWELDLAKGQIKIEIIK